MDGKLCKIVTNQVYILNLIKTGKRENVIKALNHVKANPKFYNLEKSTIDHLKEEYNID